MNPTNPILIAGGGIGGLTAAIILAQNGRNVHLFEQSGAFSEIGAGLQISPNAMQVHRAIKTDKAIIKAGFAPEYAALRHYKTGHIHLKTPLKHQCETRYGAPYIHIHRADLQRILLASAKAAGVIFHMATRVEAYRQDSSAITLETDKGAFKGSLLIGADGIKSAIHLQMSKAEKNPPIKPRFTGQIAWRGIIPASALPPRMIAPAANIWMGPGQHFVAYYLRGGDLINFIAAQDRKEWAEESWSFKGDKSKLAAAFNGWDTSVTHLIKACETPYIWGLFDRQPLNNWQDGRAVLLGDAAHPMLPFMAQGAAMAIEDAWVLSHKILTCHNGGDTRLEALAQYVNIRRPRTAALQKTSQQNAKMFHTSSAAQLCLRRAQLSLAHHIPVLQHMKLGSIYGLDVTKTYPI
jgi:salicylate hydroxylase